MNKNQLNAYRMGLQAGQSKIPSQELPGDEKSVSNKLRSDWNSYVQWLSTKGLKGHPDLDKNDTGLKMIEEYRKENPTTSITKDSIVPIQKEFQNYRQWVINRIKTGKGAAFQPGTTEENFMKDLSIVDGIPGKKTTSFSFPDAYLTYIENGQKTKTVDQGFSTITP